MPILLEPPAHRPGGPDGRGWSRLSLNAHMGTGGPQCALRPRSYPDLWIASRDTRHAQWGGHGPCTGGGDCSRCPVLAGRDRRELDAPGDEVLVRLTDSDVAGWTGAPAQQVWIDGERWSWDQLAALRGWRVGRAVTDEQGHGFWLHREVTDGAA